MLSGVVSRYRYRSARTARKPDGVVAEMDQQRLSAVRVVVDAADRFRVARAKVQAVHQRAGRTARLSQTSRGSCGKSRRRTDAERNRETRTRRKRLPGEASGHY